MSSIDTQNIIDLLEESGCFHPMFMQIIRGYEFLEVLQVIEGARYVSQSFSSEAFLGEENILRVSAIIEFVTGVMIHSIVAIEPENYEKYLEQELDQIGQISLREGNVILTSVISACIENFAVWLSDPNVENCFKRLNYMVLEDPSRLGLGLLPQLTTVAHYQAIIGAIVLLIICSVYDEERKFTQTVKEFSALFLKALPIIFVTGENDGYTELHVLLLRESLLAA